MRNVDPTTPDHPRQRSTYAQVRWWAGTYAVAVVTLAGGTASLLAGEPLGATLALFAVTVTAGTGGIRARTEFRTGWRRGYESAVRTMLQHQAGLTPDVEVRAAVHGDPTPEPWDEHVPPIVVRRPA
jgi:hypothetical protein